MWVRVTDAVANAVFDRVPAADCVGDPLVGEPLTPESLTVAVPRVPEAVTLDDVALKRGDAVPVPRDLDVEICFEWVVDPLNVIDRETVPPDAVVETL